MFDKQPPFKTCYLFNKMHKYSMSKYIQHFHTHTHNATYVVSSKLSTLFSKQKAVAVRSAATLPVWRLGAVDRVGAVTQHELRRVLVYLVCDGHAVACQQLPGHEDEGCLHVLGLLGRGFQGSQHAVVFCQSARLLEQNLPLSFKVGLITCRD